MKTTHFVLLGFSLVGLAGCGAAEDGFSEGDFADGVVGDGAFAGTDVSEADGVENVGVIQEALSAYNENCFRTQEDEIISGGTWPYVFSPRTYTHSDCSKAYIITIHYYAPPSPTYYDKLTVAWADSKPTSQTWCEAAWGQAILWDQYDPTPIKARSAYGRWYNGSCFPPKIQFPEVQWGGQYRIAATMRQWKSSSAPTRKLSITHPNIIR